MNEFLSVISACKDINPDSILKRGELKILQINMGNLCNQACGHCHVAASPQGGDIMPKRVIDEILAFLSVNRGLAIDITGGAPELNPDFDYLISKARPLTEEIIVRSNLTVFFEPGKDYLPGFFKKQRVHLICSLPCYARENVDAQRGEGVFDKSIRALKELNRLGFGEEEGLRLDIVYNPLGEALPLDQKSLEAEYRRNLKKDFDINFNNLVTITNVPIKRFKTYLEREGKYEKYLHTLKQSFNRDCLPNIMCRSFLSAGYDGRLYDCDFNQALGWALKNNKGEYLTIGGLDIKALEGRDILVGEHCLSCTAGYGSSCKGALIDAKQLVKDYYGNVLKSKSDLKTSACCTGDGIPSGHREILKKIHPEILDRFYGCGSPLPPELKDRKVLDLGCGTGRDVYLVSYLAGENGFVTGVDMTDEQLNVANKHLGYQMRVFGFSKTNVEFKKGYIEDLKEAGIEDNSLDVVISNCVINLSPDKEKVFREILRVLKPGGELYFSDVFAGRRVPAAVRSDPVLYGECLGGALYIEDFRRILKGAGCPDYRVASSRKLALDNQKVKEKAGMIDFYSMTIRAFKLADLEDICEDYGQVAVYLGTIAGYPHEFVLDDRHIFVAHKPMLVCGNTASMLSQTRFAAHFRVTGDRSSHFGPFACKPAAEIKQADGLNGGGCC